MDIAELLINYKHNVASKYLPVRGDQIGTRVFEMEKYYLSTKIDGHLCFIYKEGNNISILNHNNKPFDRAELNKELESILKDQEGLFVGEIHLHHENKRTRSYDLTKEISNEIRAVKKKTNGWPYSADLEYHAKYDESSLNGLRKADRDWIGNAIEANI